MSRYYVNKNAQSNGDHEVENRIYLGEFASCRPAVAEAKKYYAQVNGCYYCARDCHTQWILVEYFLIMRKPTVLWRRYLESTRSDEYHITFMSNSAAECEC